LARRVANRVVNDPLTEDDEGKRVVGPNDEEIGTIEKVDTGVAHVNPDGEPSEAIRERLDWGEQGDYTVQETEVEDVTDGKVVLETEP
jgi:hypothetical protein